MSRIFYYFLSLFLCLYGDIFATPGEDSDESPLAVELGVRSPQTSSTNVVAGALLEPMNLGGFSKQEVYTAALEAEASYFSGNLEAHIAEVPCLQQARVVVFRSPAEDSGIVLFKNSGEVVISYHGTSSLRNLATDLWATISFPFFIDKGWVHSGFYHGFLRSWDNLYPLLADHAASLGLKVSDLDITVTGHSLGAALATICAYRLAKVSAVKKLRVVTFASPRVLSCSAAAGYRNILLGDEHTKLGSVTLRVAQIGDPITNMPHFAVGYKHVGGVFEIEHDKAYNPHEMMGYIAGIEAFLNKGSTFATRKQTSYGLMRSLRSVGYSSELESLSSSPQVFKKVHRILGEDPDKIIEKTYQVNLEH